MMLNLPVQLTTANSTITGAIDGVNRTFVLAGQTPTGQDLFWNGVFLTNGLDYVLSGNTVTLITTSIPSGTDIISARVWTS
jgi:hypothetical protein